MTDENVALTGGLPIDPALLMELKRIELVTRRRIDTDLLGRYRSAFRGSGLLFSDLREYQPGDDVKHIHWRVTARTGRTFVKSYEEDRHLQVLVAVDISKSTGCGAFDGDRFRSAQQRASEFAGLLTLLGMKSQDSVGLLLFSDQVHSFLPPKRSRMQTRLLLLELMRTRNLPAQTDLRKPLEHLRAHARRGAIIFIVSDFYSPPFESELKALAFSHDVVLVHLADPNPQYLPKSGLVEMRDAEGTGTVLIDASSSRFRDLLLKQRSARSQLVSELAKRSGADYLMLGDGSPLRPLRELMERRSRRMR